MSDAAKEAPTLPPGPQDKLSELLDAQLRTNELLVQQVGRIDELLAVVLNMANAQVRTATRLDQLEEDFRQLRSEVRDALG